MPQYEGLSSLVPPSVHLNTTVLESEALGDRHCEGSQKSCPFSFISEFEGVDSSDPHDEGEAVLVVGQLFVLMSAKVDQTISPGQHHKQRGRLGLDHSGDTGAGGTCVCVTVRGVLLTRFKHKGERLVSSVAGSHLAALKPKAMRWTYSSSLTSQASAVAGRSTTPQRVRHFPGGSCSLSTAFVNTNSLCAFLSQKYNVHSLSHGIRFPPSETCSLSIDFRTTSLSAARLGIT